MGLKSAIGKGHFESVHQVKGVWGENGAAPRLQALMWALGIHGATAGASFFCWSQSASKQKFGCTPRKDAMKAVLLVLKSPVWISTRRIDEAD